MSQSPYDLSLARRGADRLSDRHKAILGNIRSELDDLQRTNAELTKAKHAALQSLVTTAKDRNRVSAELVAMTEERDESHGREVKLACHLKAMAKRGDTLTAWLVAAVIAGGMVTTGAIIGWLT